MKKNSHIKFLPYLILPLLLFSLSCEDYLDKSPDADITDEDVFSKYYSFQGFMEDAYQCMVECMNRNIYGFGDAGNYGDELVGGNPAWMVRFDDNCDYWGWMASSTSPFYSGQNPPPTNNGDYNNRTQRGYWDTGWLGIRKVNMALEHIDDLVEPYQNGSLEEQKNFIKGQALFLRAYFHFEILRAWGGIPYIDKELMPNDAMRFPRLSYRETALKIAEDLNMAAGLLPENWDLTQTGTFTQGINLGKITKGAALALLGKNYLYAASPFINGLETGSYEYDAALCLLAAKAFYQVLQLRDKGIYELNSFENYYDNFYKYDGTAPLTRETILSAPVTGYSRWLFGGWTMNRYGGWGHYRSPTQNYVENYGMANGLPITDDNSGFDPLKPFSNRDPRFYKDIIIDGDRMAENASATEKGDEFAQFYLGGNHRGADHSISGYGWRKFYPLRRNLYDDQLDGAGVYTANSAKIRLADVYLMYAEAMNEVYGPTQASPEIPGGIPALQAVNVVRTRAGVPNVDSKYASDKLTFRETIRNERAVELAFEGHRWYDLRRWYLAHLPKFKEKYVLDFDKDHTYFTKRLLLTKPFEMKHYWLPFPTDQVNVYPEFYQNTGW